MKVSLFESEQAQVWAKLKDLHYRLKKLEARMSVLESLVRGYLRGLNLDD